MRPSSRLVIALAVLTAAGLALSLAGQALWPWLFLLVALALATLADGLLARRTSTPAVERAVSNTMALGAWTDVTLDVRNDGARTLGLSVFDHHPPPFRCRNLSQTLVAPPGRTVTIRYAVKPTRRGRWHFPGCQLLLRSPLGLLTASRFVETTSEVNVYPNYSTATKFALLGTDNIFSQSGIRRRQRRGEGTEFQQLREYRQGDTFRQIDWKATARMARLIAKEYQDERDQQVVFVLDTGRRMLTREGEFSHFDHVLNAMLLLSYVALRQGDAVGFMSLGDPGNWMKPRKGVGALNLLLRRTFDLEPAPVAMDYEAGATALAVRQKRRALIVVLTNVRDEDTDDLGLALKLLRRRHLVLVASLREAVLDERLDREVSDFDSALGFAATCHYLAARRKAHERLASTGVLLQDATCEALPAAITNRYLDIKRAGLL